jgi:hypothetical protein
VPFDFSGQVTDETFLPDGLEIDDQLTPTVEVSDPDSED